VTDAPWANDPIYSVRTDAQPVNPGAPWKNDAPYKEDWGRAGASGAKRGFIGLPGMFGDWDNLTGQFVDKLGKMLPDEWITAAGGDPVAAKAAPPFDYAALNNHLTSAQANQAWDKITGDKPYEAVTQGERYMKALGATAPALLGANKGNALQILGAMLGGGVGSEFSGQVAQKYAPEWEAEARLLGGALGGGFGAKAPRRLSSIANALEPAPNAMGMFGGQIRRKTKGLPPVEVNKTLAERAGYLGPKGAEKFDEWYEPYRQTGAHPYNFQAYQEPGVSKAASITRQPGETPQLAKEKIEGPVTGDKQRTGARYKMQTRALKAADEMTGGPEKLADELKQASDAYKDILTDDAVSPALESRVQKILDRVDDDDHEAITAEAQKLARAEGVGEMNQAQFLQFVKRALWQKGEALAAKEATAQRGRAYKQIFNDLRNALHADDGIAGYRAVDEKFSDVVTRSAAAAALREKIKNKPEGHAPGTIAMNPTAMEELAATFGEQPASNFILNQRVLGADARDLNRVVPWSGSPTVSHLGEQVDSAAMIAEALKSGRPVEGAIRGFGHFVDKTLGGAQEKGRNALGEHLLDTMSPEQAAAFRATLQKLAREKQAADLAQALAAGNATQQGGGNAAQ
jgi:hypothetical protein